MPRPSTSEEGGEAQWGKEELARGVPFEQRGESLLNGGRDASKSLHGLKPQSQVYKLPAIFTLRLGPFQDFLALLGIAWQS